MVGVGAPVFGVAGGLLRMCCSGQPWWEWLSEVAMATEWRAMLVVVAVVAGGSKGRDLVVGVGEVC